MAFLVVVVAMGFKTSGTTNEVPSGWGAGASQAARRLFDGDFADPYILVNDGAYFAFATGRGHDHIAVARSSDLRGWDELGEALPELPTWALRADGLTWAPSAVRVGDQFVLYYTAPDAQSGYQCISRAVASRPEGPYVDKSPRPFVCQTQGPSEAFCGSIDPSPFVDDGGERYLLWKSDENSAHCRTPPRIWMRRLSDDALDVIGDAIAILTKDAPWEGTLVEAPSMVRANGKYVLFYSANWYDGPDYAVGYAYCPGPMRPCVKKTAKAPWLKSSGALLGPGGTEVFSDEAGNKFLTYHAWTWPNAGYRMGGARSLRLARLQLNADDLPELLEMPPAMAISGSGGAPSERTYRLAR